MNSQEVIILNFIRYWLIRVLAAFCYLRWRDRHETIIALSYSFCWLHGNSAISILMHDCVIPSAGYSFLIGACLGGLLCATLLMIQIVVVALVIVLVARLTGARRLRQALWFGRDASDCIDAGRRAELHVASGISRRLSGYPPAIALLIHIWRLRSCVI